MTIVRRKISIYFYFAIEFIFKAINLSNLHAGRVGRTSASVGGAQLINNYGYYMRHSHALARRNAAAT